MELPHFLVGILFKVALHAGNSAFETFYTKLKYILLQFYLMQSPTISQKPLPYPMTHMAGSPIANLGYHYPMQSPPMQTALPNLGIPNSVYGGYAQGSRQIPAGSFVGGKSIEQLNKGIYYLPGHGNIQTISKDILTTENRQHQFLASHNAIGIQAGYSQIEYIPYQSYYIDYEQRQFIQNVRVPVEKRVTDYYAVEHVTDYIPKEIQETVVEMVPEERTSNKLFYVPVQTQLVHLPQDTHQTQKTQIQKQVSATNITSTQERIVSRPVQQVVQQPVIQQQVIQQQVTQQPVPQVIQQPVQQVQVQQVQVKQPVQQIQQVQQVQQVQVPQGGLTKQIIDRQIYQNIQAPQQVPPQVIAAQRTVQNSQPVMTAQTQRTQSFSAQPPVSSQLIGGPGQGQQFIQNAQVLQANMAEIQKQYQVPDNAKVNYQYSTKTVRSLSPDQMAKMGIKPRTTTQQSVSPQPITTEGSTKKIATTTLAPPPQQGPTTLMRNNQVDLADSEHIDITKSTFNKFYGNQNQTSLGTSNQASYAINKNQSSFSFADQVGGNFASINRNSGESQPNRISGGSVYDYDQQRKDY